MKLRLVFFGTPAFAVPSLSALESSRHRVVAVVTQPDRRRGRGQHVAPEAVKRTAAAHGLPVLQPERLSDPDFVAAFDALDADLGVVVAYGRILPAAVLNRPRLGLINVHASILPRWRGAAPVHRAILAGDTRTGVTIMRVVQALDSGPILMSEETEIGLNETSAELADRLAILGAGLLVPAVDAIDTGVARERAQDDSLATYAPRLERHEGRLNWAQPATAVHNHIRGLQPWPMAGARLGGRLVFFVRSDVQSPTPADAPPGTIVAVLPDAIEVAAALGTIRVLVIQPEGRRAMTVRAFLGGRPVVAGERFESLPTSTT